MWWIESNLVFHYKGRVIGDTLVLIIHILSLIVKCHRHLCIWFLLRVLFQDLDLFPLTMFVCQKELIRNSIFETGVFFCCSWLILKTFVILCIVKDLWDILGHLLLINTLMNHLMSPLETIRNIFLSWLLLLVIIKKLCVNSCWVKAETSILWEQRLLHLNIINN